MSRFNRRLLATAVAAAMALPVLAQVPANSPAPAQAETAPARSAGQPMRPNAQQREQMREKMHERMAQRMAAFKQKLQLTAAQENDWNTFTAAMKPGERTARLDMQGMGQLTTPERIDRMRAIRAQRSAEADRRGEATKAFYATLTPQQQKTFDAQSLRMGGGREGGRWHHGEGRKGSEGPGHRHGMHHGKAGGPTTPAQAPAAQ
ncbi:hypothetical protein B2J88_33630 [Rhodococcus sp. SRB_17]|nr:hypothetical protein [Rhodococcus sp. SRB_17]